MREVLVQRGALKLKMKVDLHRDERIVESHYAQSQVDDVCEEAAEAKEMEQVNAHEPHCCG